MCQVCASLGSDYGDLHPDRSLLRGGHFGHQRDTGVQWLITLGKVTTDWETLEMEWTDKKTGRHEKIRGMHTYPPQTVSAHRMEADFRKGDIQWAVELRVSKAGSTGQVVHPDVQSILDKYATVFGEIPPGQPLDRGFEHTIELEQGIQAVITTTYRHPKATGMRLRGPFMSS